MYLPADRLKEGSFPELASVSNLVMKSGRGGTLVNHGRERAWAAGLLSQFGVVPADPSAPFRTLSGGNQQKVLLAKWLEANPRVLVADEPFSGVDVGARAALRARIAGAAARGVAVLLVTSNPEDITELAHRAVVFRGGEPALELQREDLTVERITEACMAGSLPAEA